MLFAVEKSANSTIERVKKILSDNEKLLKLIKQQEKELTQLLGDD